VYAIYSNLQSVVETIGFGFVQPSVYGWRSKVEAIHISFYDCYI